MTHQHLLTIGTFPITYKSFKSLNCWLDDEIINLFLGFFRNLRPSNFPDITILNTQFYSTLTSEGLGNQYDYQQVERWTRKA